MRLVPIALIFATACAPKLASLESSVLASAQDPAAWEALGDAYKKNLKRRRAQQAYAHALEIGGSEESLNEKLADSPSRGRRLQRRALRNPGDDEIWGDLGDKLRAAGDVNGARAAYLHAMNLDPEDSEWSGAVAELGMDAEGVARFRLRTNMDDDESVGDLADLLKASGETEEACEMYARASALDPGDSEWQGVQGCASNPIASIMPSSTESPHDLQSLEAALNGNTGLLVKLGRAHAKAGDLAKAEEYLYGALLVNPTDTEALDAAMVVMGSTKRRLLERLVRDMPNADEVHGELADHYLELGLMNEARGHYRIAVDLDPDDPEWITKLDLLNAVRPQTDRRQP